MKVLRIGVDARELAGDATGAGRQRRLRRHAAEQRIVGRGTGTWWEQTALRRAVRADAPDVFFAPAYTAPIGTGVPTAVTIHDISFIAHPEWFRPRERLRRRWLTRRTARDASVIFTDSAFSRAELETRLQVPADRIQVIAPGVSSIGSDHGGVRRKPGPGMRDDSEIVSNPLSPLANPDPRHPLVLYVGSIFNRRRLPDLIAAFARATSDMPEARLVIVGHDRTWPLQDLGRVAADEGVGAKIDVRRYVDETELADLYRRASVFGFLSEYEGFGRTPLEALAAGVPVVVTDTAIAREVYGDAADFVRQGDVAGAAARLRTYLTTPAARAEMLQRAPAILARYSWDRAADATLHEIERVARA